MTTTAMLIKEIRTLPKAYRAEALDFILFLKKRTIVPPKRGKISIKDAHGIFKDLQGKLDSTIERDEEDRVGIKQTKKISIDDAYGIFKGIDTHFERDEEDRV